MPGNVTVSEPCQRELKSSRRWKVALPANGAGGVTVAELSAGSKAKVAAGAGTLTERSMKVSPRSSELMATNLVPKKASLPSACSAAKETGAAVEVAVSEAIKGESSLVEMLLAPADAWWQSRSEVIDIEPRTRFALTWV